MYNSRYSKFLTIALIIVIIIIVGLLIFWGVDSLTKYNVNSDAEQGIEAFKNKVQSNSTPTLVLPNSNKNNSLNLNSVIVDPYANLVVPEENLVGNGGNSNSGSSGGNSSNGSSVTNGNLYKGFPMVGYIEIPKTDIELPVLKEATIKAMEASVCILTGPGLNQPGVTVISGHNYRNGLFFSDNAKLAVGDKIYVTDETGQTITYVIYKKYQTTPEDASYATVDTEGKREVVLTTCTDDSKNRIIICAEEI